MRRSIDISGGVVTCFVGAKTGQADKPFAQARRSRNVSTPALYALSPTARLWSRPGMTSASAIGIIAANFAASPATTSRAPTATSVCWAMRATAAAVRVLARAAGAGGERGAVAFRLVGEGAEHALRRVGEIGERGRLHRLGNADGQARAMHQPVAETTEDQRAHEFGPAERQERGDARAHRIAHHVGALDPEAPEEIGRVAGHQVGAIVARGVELLARAVAAVVEGDDPPPGMGQRLDPARIDPVDAMVRGEAVDEEDRLAAVVALGGDVDIGDLDAVGRELPQHAGPLAGSGIRGPAPAEKAPPVTSPAAPPAARHFRLGFERFQWLAAPFSGFKPTGPGAVWWYQ